MDCCWEEGASGVGCCWDRDCCWEESVSGVDCCWDRVISVGCCWEGVNSMGYWREGCGLLLGWSECGVDWENGRSRLLLGEGRWYVLTLSFPSVWFCFWAAFIGLYSLVQIYDLWPFLRSKYSTISILINAFHQRFAYKLCHTVLRTIGPSPLIANISGTDLVLFTFILSTSSISIITAKLLLVTN